MDFEQMKEKFKESEDFTSALSQIESEYKALSGKKETAVENEIKLRNAKQDIARTLGLEENTPVNELVAKVGETFAQYKTKIDSFQKNASSKELEAAQFNENFQKMQEQLQALSKANEEKDAAIRMNALKDKFGKALNDANIKDASAQELVFEGYLSKAGNVEDLNAFAKSIAESKPFLTQSIHKQGAGTRSASSNNVSSTLRDIDVKDTKSRVQAIADRIAQK